MTTDNENLNKKLDELLQKANLFFSEINEIRELVNSKNDKESVIQDVQEPKLGDNEPLEKKIEEEKIISPSPVQNNYSPPVERVNKPLNQPFVPQQKYVAQQYKKPNNNSVEKFIGENLINKIGIVILVLGIGFFVKYAIDKNWINEAARTAIGVLSGFVIIGFGYLLRKKYRAFSSVLCGGGISVLYFSIYIALRQYELFSQVAAFVIFIIITSLSIILSLWFDRKELAIIAIAGGFISPLMASTGNGNYIVLFSYLFLLNSGILVLAYKKRWNVLNIISFGFTVLFFVSWLFANVFFRSIDPFEGAFIFGTIFFLQFFAMNILNTLREKRSFGVFEIIMLSANNFFYICIGIAIVVDLFETDMRGVFAASLGLFNMIFWAILHKKQNIDKVFKYLLLGFGISFLSIAGPMQLHDNFVTLFFATEFVLLFWIAIKSKLKLLFSFSSAVLFVVLVSLSIDWAVYYNTYTSEELPVIINRAFLTSLFVIFAVVVNMLINTRLNEIPGLSFFSKRTYNAILTGVLIFLVFCTIQFELSFQMSRYFDARAIQSVINYTFVSAYFMTLLLFFRNNSKNFISVILAIIIVFITFLYPFTSHSNTVIIRNFSLCSNALNIWAFYFHYLNLAFVTFGLYLVYNVIKIKTEKNPAALMLFQWFVCILAVFIVSTETAHISVLINYTSPESIPEILRMTNKMSFSVIWGLTSFVFMVLGLLNNVKNLRVISLSLFTLTLLKLFTYDIIDMSAGAKTVAFICLGILLLLISFLYQKLKKLIFDDDNDSAE